MNLRNWKTFALVATIAIIFVGLGVVTTRGIETQEIQEELVLAYEKELISSYTSEVEPSILYEGTVVSDDRLYLTLTKQIDVNLTYSFSTNREFRINNSYITRTVLENADEEYGWEKDISNNITQTVREEEQDNVTTLEFDFSYDIREIEEVVEAIEDDTGLNYPKYVIKTEVGIRTLNTTKEGSDVIIDEALSEGVVISWEQWGFKDDKRVGIIEITTSMSRTQETINKEVIVEKKNNKFLKSAMPFTFLVTLFTGAFATRWRYKKDKEVINALSEAQRILRDNHVLESKNMFSGKKQELSNFRDLKNLSDDYYLEIFHTKDQNKDIFYCIDQNVVYFYQTK
ncbi:hypothetical protein C9439_02870 [archaeon SCG-AAA382B04]|nr:hypothetical protein C9439_02870 [archaeon SCG-AAA382B04]